MDILDVIKKEHREVSAMLNEVQKCEPGDKRLMELARSISQALSTHVKIEERLFYARLRDRAEDEEQKVDMYEAYTEHDVANHLLDLIKSGRKPDEKFKAELQVLGESVKHHVKEEESTVFKIAREKIDGEEREQLGDQWMKARQRMDSQAATAPGSRGTSTRGSRGASSTSSSQGASANGSQGASSNGSRATAKKKSTGTKTAR